MSDRAFDRAVSDWLEDGSDRTPPPAINAVLLAVRTTPQDRTPWSPRRFTYMPSYMRLVASIAVVAVVGAGAIWYAGQNANVGGPTSSPTAAAATPPPTAAATATAFAFDPYTWKTYTSQAYGYTTEIPSGWNVLQAASREWDPTVDVPYPDGATSPALDIFTNEDGDVAVSIWRMPVDSGSTQEFRNVRESFFAWAKDFCESTDSLGPCSGIAEREIPMCHYTPGCSPDAMIVPFDTDVLAFFGSSSDMVTVVQVWRVDTDPEVAEYGGATAILQAFLDPLNVRLAPPGDG
jgi:hypothetical protein